MKKYFVFLSLATLVLGFSGSVSAQKDFLNDAQDQLNHAGGAEGANLDPIDPRLVVAKAIKLALTFIATILFVLNIYAGYQWMTARGNDEQVGKAKATIWNSTIGLIIILGAYGITIAVTNLAMGRNLSSGANQGSSLDKALENGDWW